MHLLVLSAFRPKDEAFRFIFDSVSMHLLVLSAFRPGPNGLEIHIRMESQCTFWCSVLSDPWTCSRAGRPVRSLNAPFGAQCFPTDKGQAARAWLKEVSMHLLVLSAFRREKKETRL